MIKHHPILPIERVCALYSQKDGVPIKYVCTSALYEEEAVARDIFYRDTPHPDFGNRYFGLFYAPLSIIDEPVLMICDADNIESLTFSMIEGENGWEYSQHRHDFRQVPGTGLAIDGGRSYCRLVGNNLAHEPRDYRIVDGVFV